MMYEVDRSYLFPVLAGSPDDDFFRLEVNSDSGEYTVAELPRLPFQKQKDYEQPTQLLCRVKSINENGVPVLGHVVAPYVNELYRDTFARGESIECEVTTVPSKPAEDPFMVRDRHGIFFRLDEPEGLLAKGQIVRCKFTQMTPRFFHLTRVDEGAKLPFYSPEIIIDAIGASYAIRQFILSMLNTWPQMEQVRHEIIRKNPLWIFSASRTVLRHLPEWFMQADLFRHRNVIRALLNTQREVLLYLLEGSGFLNSVSTEHRRAMRQQLTELVESIEPYEQTLSLIEHHTQDLFVEKLLDKLQKSGYLYHPSQQFAVLMIIFRLYPDKVGNYLSRIFESIFGRDLENWKREPFRSAFVEQFEIYVRLARRQIDELPLAESREQKSRLENIITAIALQLLLVEKSTDVSRSESLFYRYISLLRPFNTESLLTKSFLSLLGVGVNSRLNYAQLKEPMMMMTQATVMPAGDVMTRIKSTHRYTNNDVDITVSSTGIELSLSKRRDITEKVIPEGLMPWLSPQIRLNGIKSLSGNRLRKLSDHNQWWHDIEHSLFETNNSSAPTQPEPESALVRSAEKGDEVYIVIDKVDDFYTNNPTFECHIEDSEFTEGTGILKRDQIIGYNLKQPSERAYVNADGTQLGFLATVLDKRPDGSYIFSLRNEVDRFIEEYYNYDDIYTAIIAGVNEHDYSAISRDGIGLFIEIDNEAGKGLQIGDIVNFRIKQKGKQGQVRAYAVAKSLDPTDRFDKSDAFMRLMRSIGEDSGDDTAESRQIREEELMRDLDEILNPGDIREIIGIIRFKAIAESDLIKAYDYLRFGRLLALVIGDTELSDNLGTHAALLTMHQYYATNTRIDSDKLEALQPRAVADPLLNLIYHRLEMVSWLDRPDKVPGLYRSATEPSNELEGTLARLVLSYNMLRASENDSTASISAEIKQQIMKTLNVNNETRRGKYYGSESKYLEFKTSIVFPATAPGEEMREDPEAQQFHIMSRIAGLLNANGGRLYLGVNNDGYEVGLHDDFKYFERKPATVGRYTFKIKTLDNLCVFLENLINESFGESTARKIEVSVDEEAEKGVILIDVKESLEPVFLRERLFVRQSGQSTREYHGSAIDDFLREREELRAERAHLLSLDSKEPEIARAEENDAAPVVHEPVKNITSETPVETANGSNLIPISAWKPNVCHSYESGYAEPFGYLYFMGENTLKFTDTDLYTEPGDKDCRQVLVIPHEQADSFLILAFDNERVLRVPLAEIYEKGINTSIEYNTDYKLMFATIASKDDALVCVGADSGGTLWRRVTRVSSLDNAHIANSPRRIHDAPVHHTVFYEIADANALEHFTDSLSENLSGKRFGATMRVKENAPGVQQKINMLIAECANS